MFYRSKEFNNIITVYKLSLIEDFTTYPPSSKNQLDLFNQFKSFEDISTKVQWLKLLEFFNHPILKAVLLSHLNRIHESLKLLLTVIILY